MKALPLLILIVFVLSACNTTPSNLPSSVSIPSQATLANNTPICTNVRNFLVGFSGSGYLIFSADCYQISGDLPSFRTSMTETMIRAGYSFGLSQSLTENGGTVTIEVWEWSENPNVGKILMYSSNGYFAISDGTT